MSGDTYKTTVNWAAVKIAAHPAYRLSGNELRIVIRFAMHELKHSGLPLPLLAKWMNIPRRDVRKTLGSIRRKTKGLFRVTRTSMLYGKPPRKTAHYLLSVHLPTKKA